MIARMSFIFAFVATMSVLATGITFLLVFAEAGGSWSLVGSLGLLTIVAFEGFAATDAIVRGSSESLASQSRQAASVMPADAGVFGKLWADAHRKDPSVPAFGSVPYWSSQGGAPPSLVSMIGLQGKAYRLKAAMSPELDANMRVMMARDPDSDVRAAATRYR